MIPPIDLNEVAHDHDKRISHLEWKFDRFEVDFDEHQTVADRMAADIALIKKSQMILLSMGIGAMLMLTAHYTGLLTVLEHFLKIGSF